MTERIHIDISTKCRRTSKQRPKSLITSIPPIIRDSLELNHGDQLIWELYKDENKKYIKIIKQE